MRRRYRILILSALLLLVALLYWRGGAWFAHGAPELKPVAVITPGGSLVVPQKGRWQLIYLWSSHAPFSVEGLHKLEAIYHADAERLAVLALEVDGKGSPKAAVPWGYLPSSLKRRVVKDWKVHFLPMVIIVDPRGRVRQRFLNIDGKELRNYLAFMFFLDRGESR